MNVNNDKCIKLTFEKDILHTLSEPSHNNFRIEERRRKVASMHARSMNETEIAVALGCDQSTISRDIKALKEMSQSFIYDLAKSDLAYFYQQSWRAMDEVLRETWSIFNLQDISIKEKLASLKLIQESIIYKEKIMAEGPAIMAIKSMEELLNRIEEEHQTA